MLFNMWFLYVYIFKLKVVLFFLSGRLEMYNNTKTISMKEINRPGLIFNIKKNIFVTLSYFIF